MQSMSIDSAKKRFAESLDPRLVPRVRFVPLDLELLSCLDAVLRTELGRQDDLPFTRYTCCHVGKMTSY